MLSILVPPGEITHLPVVIERGKSERIVRECSVPVGKGNGGRIHIRTVSGPLGGSPDSNERPNRRGGRYRTRVRMTPNDLLRLPPATPSDAIGSELSTSEFGATRSECCNLPTDERIGTDFYRIRSPASAASTTLTVTACATVGTQTDSGSRDTPTGCDSRPERGAICTAQGPVRTVGAITPSAASRTLPKRLRSDSVTSEN